MVGNKRRYHLDEKLSNSYEECHKVGQRTSRTKNQRVLCLVYVAAFVHSLRSSVVLASSLLLNDATNTNFLLIFCNATPIPHESPQVKAK